MVAILGVMGEGVVRPGGGTARQQKDQGVDQRQVPGIEGLDASRRPNAINDRRHRTHRVEGAFEEGPEPCEEEHDLGHDEEDEAIAQADADNRGVIAGLAFMDHFRPPRVHRVEDAGEADQEHVGPAVLHPQDRAEQHDEGRDGANERPDRRRKDVVVVILYVRHNGLPCGLVLSWFLWRQTPDLSKPPARPTGRFRRRCKRV